LDPRRPLAPPLLHPPRRPHPLTLPHIDTSVPQILLNGYVRHAPWAPLGSKDYPHATREFRICI
jgi:hypothetical protein